MSTIAVRLVIYQDLGVGQRDLQLFTGLGLND